ncbi:unnamed protein product [Phaedon cochleariae]|uniref:BRISC and BRCA1-A complex member 2 n=1 Tax=Phaedon cochleariae TaxID=80249 RepID=A0A9N9X296_PHACE|nr:unnamed protein product [Phaedon cochleariae]
MEEASFSTDNILSNFPSCLRKNIEELCLRSKIGLSSITLNDITIPKISCAAQYGILDNFHFILKVPYAGKKMKWEVIFDPEDFFFTPDFLFNDDEFLENPQYDYLMDNVPSLNNWDLKNPQALAKVLNEFLGLYKKLQVEKLRTENIYSRYWEEYEALTTKESGIGPEQIEVQVGNNIDFLVSLPVDCSALPPYAQPVIFRNSPHNEGYNPGFDFAHLKITILELDGARTNASLQLSPRLMQVLGPSKNINLPSFQNMALVTYVDSVSKMIETRIAAVVDHYVKKKVYIVNMAAMCSKSIIEYDAENFNKAVFLYDDDDDEYNCLVTVSIGAKFPQEKPTVQLSSIYCQDSKFCNETIDKYPYKPSHKPEVNIEHLLEYLGDVVKKFKCHKHK